MEDSYIEDLLVKHLDLFKDLDWRVCLMETLIRGDVVLTLLVWPPNHSDIWFSIIHGVWFSCLVYFIWSMLSHAIVMPLLLGPWIFGLGPSSLYLFGFAKALMSPFHVSLMGLWFDFVQVMVLFNSYSRHVQFIQDHWFIKSFQSI